MSVNAVSFFDGVARGDFLTLVTMLADGFDRNARNPDGNTALHFSLVQNRQDMAIFLIQRGFDIEATGKSGMKPLDMSFLFACHDVTVALIRAGAEIDTRGANYALCYSERNLPILSAIWERQDDAQRGNIAEECLKDGYVDGFIHLCDKQGVDMQACLDRQKDVLDRLPESEADKIRGSLSQRKAQALEREMHAAVERVAGGLSAPLPAMKKLVIRPKNERQP